MRARPVPDIPKFLEQAEKKTAPTAVSAAAPGAGRASRAADKAAMRAILAGSSLDQKKIDQLAGERAAAQKRLAADTRKRAIAASKQTAKRLAPLAALPDVGIAPTDPWQPGSFILDTATFIRSWPDTGDVHDSNIGPQANWAEYHLEESGDAVGRSDVARVSFYTLWQNPREEAVTAAVSARVVANAHLTVNADWNGVAAWFISDSHAQATVRARISLWPLWSQGAVIVADQTIGSAAASGGFFGGDDDRSIAFLQLLTGTGFPVPGSRFLLIEVSVVTEYQVNSGSIDLDGESGAFRIEVPFTIVTIPSGFSTSL